MAKLKDMVLKLHRDGMPCTEIARALGRERSSVAVTLRRAGLLPILMPPNNDRKSSNAVLREVRAENIRLKQENTSLRVTMRRHGIPEGDGHDGA